MRLQSSARLGAAVVIVCLSSVPLSAQSSPPSDAGHQHSDQNQPAAVDHSQHQMPAHDHASMALSARDGSGTSWLPDSSPMYAVHGSRGPWNLMFHENLFVQYLKDSGDRGSDQFGSINWAMGMASRPVGAGRVMFRGMVSLEPWTIGGCGYPDLLASGERCDGEKIHDQQHPHDLVMEMAAQYDAPLAGGVRWQVYGGPAGEPALGPVAFPHRVSAFPNPIAPITHHWLDSTHITFGVVTGGVYGRTWKAEASLFNGREPDEDRTDLDLAALDSYSARLWFLPTSKLALQVSAGRLTEAEADEHGDSHVDVTRVTASATYHTPVGSEGIWATTIGWGRNDESGVATNGLLAETNLSLADRHMWFGRFEVAGKTAHDLDVADSDEVAQVAKLQAGYTRYFRAWEGFKPGIGASVSAGFVPQSLEAAYGSRVNAGFGVFATFRPAAMGSTR